MLCLFCQIVVGERAAQIVYKDDQVVAFRDINPQAPVHILVVPRSHITAPLNIDGSNEQLAGHLVAVASQIARQEGFAEDGYRLVLNQGRNGGQSVFHVHLHILAGRQMQWPPG